MDKYVVNLAALLGMVGDLSTNFLAGSVLKLFKNNLLPTPENVIGDFDEADFTGYAPKTITAFGLPFYDGRGRAVVRGPFEQFETASPFTTGNLVYGWWLESAAGDLLLAGRFDAAPLSMSAVGQAIFVAPGFALADVGQEP